MQLCAIIYWSVDYLSRATSLEKTDSSSFIIHRLIAVPQTRMRVHSGVLAGLFLCKSCACSCSCRCCESWVHRCSCTATCSKCCSSSDVSSFPSHLPAFSSRRIPGPMSFNQQCTPEEIGSFPSEEQQSGSFEHTSCARILEGEKLLPANIASLIESGWRAATCPEQPKQMLAHTIWNSHLAGSLGRNYIGPPGNGNRNRRGRCEVWRRFSVSQHVFICIHPQPFWRGKALKNEMMLTH